MTTWVKLKNQQGQHWDSRIGWGIKLDETKELPDDIPAGSITAERLRMGGLIRCDSLTASDCNISNSAPEPVQVPVVKEALSPVATIADELAKTPGPPPKQAVKKKSSTRSTSRWGKKN